MTDAWIKCSERMPEETAHYLIHCPDGHTGIRLYDVAERRWDLFQQDITHWQPLPEPPRLAPHVNPAREDAE